MRVDRSTVWPPWSQNVFRTTPPSVRLARFLRLEDLCCTAQRRVSYKASSWTTTDNSTSRGSQSQLCPGIGRNIFSVKTSARKGIVSIFDFNKPRLEAGKITVPLLTLYSFHLNLSADGYAGKELAMNAVTNAQVWDRRLGHLYKRSLELTNRHNGNGVAFEGYAADCDVCAVGKAIS